MLHRLFENRLNVWKADIESLCGTYAEEYMRLMQTPQAKQDDFRCDLLEAWPFAPSLMQLLEDQVLVAAFAQETRDLIKILADLFKGRGDKSPVLTAADYSLEDEDSGFSSLLVSVSNQHHSKLREKALRNLFAVRDAMGINIGQIPHLSEFVGALSLRSLAIENLAGAAPETLHTDITRTKPIDDNAFCVELGTIVENSFNIHEIGERLVFREDENPQAKLMAFARNDKLCIKCFRANCVAS